MLFSKKIIAVTITVFIFYTIAYTQPTDKINVVTTAVPFLRISPDARAGGMGDVNIATTPDANSIYYNLAKTPFNSSPASVSLTYTPWLKDVVSDVYMVNLSGVYKLDPTQSVAAAIRYFNLGSITFTDFQGMDLGKTKPKEFSIDMGYTRKLSEKLSLGLTLRYINSNLASGYAANGNIYKTGHAVSGDISAYYTMANENGAGWRFGGVLSNLGSKIGYTNNANQKDFIPANLALGSSYTHIFQEVHSISVGLDINKLLVPAPPTPVPGNSVENGRLLTEYRSQNVISSWFRSFGGVDNWKTTQISIGAEYWYNNQFAFRMGYNHQNKSIGYQSYAAVGAGLKYDAFQLNFSYLIPSGNGIGRNPLSNTIRFSLLFDFMKK